ncbi:MAG: hypothetical protein E7184_03655 [Erysipelotrichaceae bacterium]|nr:hypothetical protein [Erysipelotrichaceae bacterium]
MTNFRIENEVNDSYLHQMINLDKEVFQGIDIGSFSKCKEWLSVNNDIYTMLLCKGKIIGYINFMPIKNEFYQKMKSGQAKDCDIKRKDIEEFNNASVKCLFTSIVISKEYQNTLAITYLWSGFIKKMKSLKVNISNIIMDCVTELGEKFAIKYLNAKFICNSSTGKIYEGYIKELL